MMNFMHEDFDAYHQGGGSITSVPKRRPLILHGDDVPSPPPYLSFLLSLGNKFVPYVSPSRLISTMIPQVRGECEALERVLIWSCYYLKHPPRFDLMSMYPYKFLHCKRGTHPSSKILEAIAPNDFAIQNAICCFKDVCFSTLSDWNEKSIPRSGVGWKSHLVEDYLQEVLVLKSDKDGGNVLMSVRAYLFEVNRHLSDSKVNGNLVYAKLAPHSDENVYLWLSQANQWRTCIFEYLEANSHDLSEEERFFLDGFFSFSPPLSMLNFYMLVKTNKCSEISWDMHGGWASRPITALGSWYTSVPATLLTFVGLTFLKCDRMVHPLTSVLVDTFDVVQRLPLILERFAFESPVLTSFDFSNLYTRIQWPDVSFAYRYWRNKFAHDRTFSASITDSERELMLWLLHPMNGAHFHFLACTLPFVTISHDAGLSLGEFLLYLVFTTNLFVAPAVGIYRQVSGFAMGARCAPPWGNLILRAFVLKACASFPSATLQFIADVLLVHDASSTPHVLSWLHKVYPSHLTFDVLALGSPGGVPFMDLFVLSLSPLRHCAFFKATHAAAYIPWCSDHPQKYRTSWIKGECARFLRLCSHHFYFRLCLRRLTLACARLGYPTHTFSPLPLNGEHKNRYACRKCRHTTGVFHAFRSFYSRSLPISWSALVGRLKSNLSTPIPGLKLFHTPKPSLSLGRRWHKLMLRSLNAFSKKKCFSIALRHTLVVLEMH